MAFRAPRGGSYTVRLEYPRYRALSLLAVATFLAETPPAAFVAEMRRWGVRHLFVWADDTRAYLAASGSFVERWREGRWSQFELPGVDTRAVVAATGTGRLTHLDALGADVELDGVAPRSTRLLHAVARDPRGCRLRPSVASLDRVAWAGGIVLQAPVGESRHFSALRLAPAGPPREQRQARGSPVIRNASRKRASRSSSVPTTA